MLKKDEITEKKSGPRFTFGPQARLIALCWFVYTFSYLGRYSFSSNITNIMDRFGVLHEDAGLVTTFFFFAYGAGQFINGLLCKKYNKKILFPAVLLVTSLANIAVFSGLPFHVIKYVWLINGIAQSVLWSSIVNILTENLDEKHLKTALVVLGSTTAVGTFITYFASFLFTELGDFMLIFPFAAAVLLAVAVTWAVTFEPTCRRIKGTNAVSTGSLSSGGPAPVKGEEPAQAFGKATNSAGKFTKTMVLTVMVFALFAVICNFLKDGLQTWVPGMLKDIYGLGDSVAILVSLILPLISGLCGAFTVFAQKYIKNPVLLTASFFTLCVGFSVLLKVLIGLSFIVSAFIFALISFMSHCINTCITVVIPFHFKNSGRSGLISGILNGCCYAGSTISAYGLGSAADNFGWDAAIILFVALSSIAAVIGFVSFRLFK